jgi:glycosyltransferase involved in cell wall biosynthesis
MSKATICLNMIVKDEAPVIRRCLDSVRPFIDHWVIIDTGSRDGTQDIIRDHLKDLPGELIERPWVDFAQNRSEALAAARGKADYVLVIDADETLESDPGFTMPPLTLDAYNLEVRYGGCTYVRKALVSGRLAWRYEGVLHEYICCDVPHREALVAGLRTIPHTDGARARNPHTYRQDALVLERALIEEPDNARYVFYLAQSYRDAGDHELALRHYRRRADMAGWSEEVWYSLYQVAHLYERMQKPWPEVMQAYLAAYEYQPDRAGPLYRIGMHFQAKGEYRTAHLFLARAMQIAVPSVDRLFVETTIYSFLLPIEYAVASYYVGDHRAAIATNNALLLSPDLPVSMVDQVTKNRRFSLDALFPPPAPADAAQPPDAPPLHVCVALPCFATQLDDTIESLVRQEDRAFSARLFGNADAPVRLPPDPRFTHNGGVGDAGRAILDYAAGLPDGAIVLMLPPGQKLAGGDALARWLTPFRDPGCSLVHGQYRHADGKLGTATPAADAADFAAHSWELAAEAVAFRARLAAGLEFAAEDGSPGAALAPTLLAKAGFAATRFVDAPLTAEILAPRKQAMATLTGTGLPQISCLMVTYDRLALAKRSIDCFAAQTYPNRELVVVTNGADGYCQALRSHTDHLGIDARFVHLEEPDLTLGRLRNISLDSANGDIICQWDDDDCNHPERLARQAEHMFRENARACLMTDHLQFLQDAGIVVWVDWTLGGRERIDQLLPGTVMMHRDDRFRYPEEGQYASRGEDTMFLNALYTTVPVASLVGHGYLYLYTYHGRNTFSKEHHHHLSTYSRTAADMHVEASRIREALSHYPIDRPVIVGGRDGPSFVL